MSERDEKKHAEMRAKMIGAVRYATLAILRISPNDTDTDTDTCV